MAVFPKKEQSVAVNPKVMNHLGYGTLIVGEITSDSDIRIEGHVKGNIISKSKTVLGATCNIEGNIQSQNVHIEGRVTGKVVVSELLVLAKTSVTTGDIMTKSLIIEEGANFNGNSVMSTQVSRENINTKEIKMKATT